MKRGTCPYRATCGRWLKTFQTALCCPVGTERGIRPTAVVSNRFEAVRKAVGIAEGFTAHSLRHAFVSALLARGVPITDVAAWLGHREISVTYRVYGHLVPSAASRARAALDAEFAADR